MVPASPTPRTRFHPALAVGLVMLLLVASVPAPPGEWEATWDGTWVVAHRGVVEEGSPENTLPALQRAVARGADAAEIDVSLTADGVPILLHDLWLERTTDGEGGIFETTWDEVSRLHSEGFPVPRFSEALEHAKWLGLPLWIDPKGLPERRAQLVDAIVAEVQAAGAEERVWLMHTPCPEGMRCIGGYRKDPTVEATTLRTHLVNETSLQNAHDAGVRVIVYWFLEDGDIPHGVDAVMTDYVPVARAEVDARTGRGAPQLP